MKKLLFSLFFLSLLFACGSPINTVANFAISPAEALVGAVITFDATASDGAITSFEWNFGDGTYGSGQIVNHAYASAKIFTVTLTIRDSDGGSKTSSSTVDIYREGMKLVLTKTYPAANPNPAISDAVPAIYIDSVIAEDPVNETASILLKETGFYPNYLSNNYSFWISLPENLTEYSGYRISENAANYYQAFVSSAAPRYFFLVNSYVGPCIGGNGGFLVIDLKLNEIGAGSIMLEEVFRRECWTNKKFEVAAYSANIEVKLQKYYD